MIELEIESIRVNKIFQSRVVLLKDINDSESDAIYLSKLLKGIPCKINLIPYNEMDGKYQRPTENKIVKLIKMK